MSNVKGITIELNADTSSFSKALKGIESESKKLQSELKSVNAALKLDPKNADLIKQKQDLLTRAISESKNAVNALKAAKDKADADMANGADVNQTQYRKLQREITFAENNLKSLTKQANDFSGLSSKIAKVGDGFTSAGSKISAAGDKVKTLSTVSAGLLTALGGMAVKAAVAADDINTMAKVTGLSTDEIQKFQYASDRIDVSIDVLTGSMSKLTKNMATASKGTGDAYSAFKTLDVEFQNQDGSLRDKQAVFSDVISALGKMENSTQRDALAMQLMGKSAQELNPLILGGADDLKKYGEEAEKAGLILSQDTLNGANELADSIDKIKATVTASMGKVGSELADNLIPIIENGTEAIVEITDAFSKMSDGQQKFLVGALALGSVASPLLKTVGGISNGLGKAIGYGSKIVGTLAVGKVATSGATTATTALGQAVATVGPAIALVGASLGVVYGATKAWGASVEYLNNKATASQQQAEQLKSNIDDTKTKLSELNSKIAEIKEKGTITLIDEKQLKALKDQKEVLEATLKLDEEMLKSQKLVAEQDAINALNKKSTGTNALELDLQTYKTDLDSAKSLNDQYVKAVESGNVDLANSFKSYVEGIAPTLDADKNIIISRKEKLTALMEGISGLTEEGRKAKAELQALIDESNTLLGIVDTQLTENPAYYKQMGKSTADYYREQGEAQLEANQKSFEELEKDLESRHTRGLISDEKYYSQKDILLKKFDKDQLSEYDSFYGAMLKFQESAVEKGLESTEKSADETVDIWQDKLKEISSDYESQTKEIENQAKAFSDRLANAELFSRETVGEDDNVLIQTNFKQKAEELEQYEQLLAQIRQNGAGNALTDEIQNLGVKDAIDYMQSLLKSDNIKQTMTDMEAYYAKANEIAKTEFSDESAALQEDVKSKITAIMLDMPDTARQQGYNTATAFLEGLSNGLGNSNTALIKTASNAINAPTQQAQQSSGLGATIIPQAGTTNLTVQLTLDGKVISETVIKNINQQSYNQGKSVIK